MLFLLGWPSVFLLLVTVPGVFSDDAQPAWSSMQTSNIPGLTLSVRVQLFVEHPINGELLILLENDSAYTLMTLSNGGTRSNVFNGTIFDDSAVFSVANYHFVQGVVAPVLRPLYSFTTAFSFLSPNSVWTLVVLESSLGSPGTLVRWVLDVNGLSRLPISLPGLL